MSRLLPFVLSVLFVFPAALAFAQEDPNLAASARTLFEEGVKLADEGHWDDAADHFRRAVTLRDSPVIRFNLAAALGELGRVVEASELFRALMRVDGTEPGLRAQAEQRLALVAARIAKLTLHASNQADGLQVELDGRPLPAAMVGVAIPVDPGAHRARLVRDGGELDTQDVTLGAGESGTLTLLARAAPTPAETAAVVLSEEPKGPIVVAANPALPPKDGESAGRRKKILGWGIGAGAVVVVAGAVLAGVLLAHQSRKASPYRGDFEPGSVNVQVSR